MIIPRLFFYFNAKANVRHTLTTCLINYELKIFHDFPFIYIISRLLLCVVTGDDDDDQKRKEDLENIVT